MFEQHVCLFVLPYKFLFCFCFKNQDNPDPWGKVDTSALLKSNSAPKPFICVASVSFLFSSLKGRHRKWTTYHHHPPPPPPIATLTKIHSYHLPLPSTTTCYSPPRPTNIHYHHQHPPPPTNIHYRHYTYPPTNTIHERFPICFPSVGILCQTLLCNESTLTLHLWLGEFRQRHHKSAVNDSGKKPLEATVRLEEMREGTGAVFSLSRGL